MLGDLARTLVDGRFKPQDHYSDDEIDRILFGSEARYLYEAPKGDKTAVRPVDDEATLWDLRYLLRDSHSPALHPDGMRGIALHNRKLYEDTVRFFEQNPQFMPPDIVSTPREAWIEDHKKQVRFGLVGASIVARVVAEQPRTAKEYGASAVRGAAVAGIATLALIAGSNIVNSLGHGGEVKLASRQCWNYLLSGEVRMKKNGTYTTNNRLLSPPTLGEVGGQFEHHEDPSLIVYTHETGLKKFAIDPFGATTELMARHNMGISKGEGFEGRRPDMPSDAVLFLEQLRRDYHR